MNNNENISWVRMELANNIRRLRKRSGCTQLELSQMINLDRTYLSQIENGKGNVTINILIKIADGLDCPITALFDGCETDAPRNLPKKEEVASPPMMRTNYVTARPYSYL